MTSEKNKHGGRLTIAVCTASVCYVLYMLHDTLNSPLIPQARRPPLLLTCLRRQKSILSISLSSSSAFHCFHCLHLTPASCAAFESFKLLSGSRLERRSLNNLASVLERLRKSFLKKMLSQVLFYRQCQWSGPSKGPTTAINTALCKANAFMMLCSDWLSRPCYSLSFTAFQTENHCVY